MKNIIFSCVFSLFISHGFSQSITNTGSMNVPRWFHQSQLLYNGKVLVFGGDNGDALNPIINNTAELYNPFSAVWTNTGLMKLQRTNFASVVLPNGNVLAIGGTLYLGGPNHLEKTSTCEIYNVANGTWVYAKSMHEARSEHHGVLLKNGKVLVVGGGVGNCELYDPSSNSWSLTGGNAIVGDDGISLVLLANGKVLATEGHNAEIYDPETGHWTTVPSLMNGDRIDHSSVLLDDERVLITGSVAFSDQNTAEIFDPISETFTVLNPMTQFRANSPAILMDNGNVLSFGIGDIFNPSDTKLIEVYNINSNTWTSSIYSQIGTQGYTIQKMGNGKILVVGGSWTSGNGASNGCAIIDQNITGCTTPNLYLSVMGTTDCWGHSGTVHINSSQNGMIYQGYMGTMPVGNPFTSAGGGIIIPVDHKTLSLGNNYISVRVKAPGCPSYLVASTGLITTNQTYPVVTANKNYLCPGDSALLDAPSGYTSYLWSNGQTSEDIYVKLIDYYFLLMTNSDGCKALSNGIPISGSPSFVDAGVDLTVCSHMAAFSLSGSPAGGEWTGIGMNNGKFDPLIAGPGIHTFSYSYCNQIDTKNITVTTSLTPSVDIAIIAGTNPSGSGAYVQFQATGTNAGTAPQYRFKVNGIVKPGIAGIFSSTTFQNNDQVICELTSNATCANPTLVASNMITMTVGPAPMIILSSPLRNSHNALANTSINLAFNQVLHNSAASDSCVAVTGSYTGNQSNGKLTYSGSGTDKLIYNPDTDFFAGERVSVTVTKKTKNAIDIPPVFPLLYSFKIEAAVAPASFVHTKVTYPMPVSPGLYHADADLTSFCAADFNADGYLDYALSSLGVKKVMIFINNHNNTFTKTIEYSSHTTGLAAGDFDNDGDVDVAYGNWDDSKVHVMFNDGVGNFPFTAQVSSSTFPKYVTAGDVNGDGTQDLIFANNNNGLHIFSYKNGSFNQAGYFTVGPNPSGICIIDLDGDYDMDIAVSDLSNSIIYIGKNNGFGRFDSQSVVHNQQSGNISSLASSDFDGDGDIDLAYSRSSTNAIAVMLNNGNAAFTTTAFNVQAKPYEINAEDYDGDGDIDIAVANKTSHSVSLRLNNGSGVFSGSLNMDVTDKLTSLLSGDFDNDKDIDIITATELNLSDSAKSLDIFTFINKSPILSIIPIARNIYCTKSVFDIFFTTDGNYSDTNQFIAQLSDASGGFASAINIGTSKHLPVACMIPEGTPTGSHYRVRVISTQPSSVITDNGSDIEIKNNCPEIISTSPAANKVLSPTPNELLVTFSNRMASNSFDKNKIQIVGAYSGLISKTGTFNGAGTSELKFVPSKPFFAGEKITIVVDSNVTDQVGTPIVNKKIIEVYAGSPTCSMNYASPYDIQNSGDDPYHDLIDFDHDNDLDIIISASTNANYGHNQIEIKKNDGAGNFGSNQPLINTNTYLRSYKIADFDNDGDFDIALTNDPNLVIYLNNGFEVFTPAFTYYIGAFPVIYAIADFDADGFIDIILEENHNALPTKMHMYKNNQLGGFVQGKVFSPPVTHSFSGLEVFDVDNDGDLDFTHLENNNILYCSKNDGFGNFVYSNDSVNIGTYYSSGYYEPGDYDNDGDVDLLIGSGSYVYNNKRIQLLSNNGNGVFSVIHVMDFPLGVESITKSDLDGDDDFDIIVCNEWGYNLYIYENLGGANFVLRKDIPISVPNSNGEIALVGDLSGDGQLDIAIFHGEHNAMSILLYQNSINVTSFSPVSLCPGSSLLVNFTTSGIFRTGNIFKAQLSNSSGSFSAPIDLPNSIFGTGSGVISTFIPQNVPPGNNYKVRIIGSEPSIVSNGSIKDLIIYDLEAPLINISGNIFTTQYPGFNHQWKLNEVLVGNSSSYSTTVSGDYKVIVTDPSNYCTDSSGVFTFTYSPNAINDLLNSKIQIYPNPSDGVLNLEVENINANELEVIIENTLGERVFYEYFQNVKDQLRANLNLSEFSKGMYTLILKSENGFIHRKLILN